MRAIKGLYDPCLCTITGHPNSSWFRVTTGVKQGGVLLPLLFIAYMDKIIKEFKEGKEEQYRGRIMTYADDITEWSFSRGEVEEDAIRWSDCFENGGMKMNVAKTKVLSRREV